MAAVKTRGFSSIEEFVESQFEFLRSIQCELKEINIAILTLKHQDKLSFNLKEAAQATGYGADTLYSYVKQGLIPATQAMRGSRIVINRKDLLEFITTRRAGAFGLNRRMERKGR